MVISGTAKGKVKDRFRWALNMLFFSVNFPACAFGVRNSFECPNAQME